MLLSVCYMIDSYVLRTTLEARHVPSRDGLRGETSSVIRGGEASIAGNSPLVVEGVFDKELLLGLE